MPNIDHGDAFSRRSRKLIVLSIKIGPPLGAVIFLVLCGSMSSGLQLEWGYLGALIAGPMLLVNPSFLLAVYVVGIVPAALSAVFSGIVADETPRRDLRLAASGAAGALATCVFPLGLVLATAFVRGPLGVFAMIAAGAFASMICTILVDCPRRHRDGYSVRI